MEDGKEGVLVDTTSDPAGKVLPVLWEFHVAGTTDSVWVYDGEIAWFVVAGWRGRYTLWHGGGGLRRKKGFEKGFLKDWN